MRRFNDRQSTRALLQQQHWILMVFLQNLDKSKHHTHVTWMQDNGKEKVE